MPNDITTWETIQCSLTAPLIEIGSHLIGDADYQENGKVVITFDDDAPLEDSEIWGDISGDMFFIKKIDLYGEYSGSSYENFTQWLKGTKGRLEAAIVWDDGSVEHLIWMDGEEYSWKGTLAELIQINTELRLAAE